jgi:Immunity protein 52
MNENPFSFEIYYGLPRRQETPAVIGAKFLDTLDALSRIDPLFANWKVLDLPAMASLPLAVARTRIATVVENNVFRNKREEPVPESGYSAIGVTDNVIPSRTVKLSVRAGALFADEMMLEFGRVLSPTDPQIVEYGMFRGALLATSTIWQPIWGCVSAFRMDYWKGPIVPGAPVILYNRFHIPWIAYISPKLATGFVVPPSDVRTEHTPGGGLLLSATKEHFDATNPEHLTRSLILAQTMVGRTGEKFEDKK